MIKLLSKNELKFCFSENDINKILLDLDSISFDFNFESENLKIIKNKFFFDNKKYDIVNYTSSNELYFLLIPSKTFHIGNDILININTLEFNHLPGNIVEFIMSKFNCDDEEIDELLNNKFEGKYIYDFKSGYFDVESLWGSFTYTTLQKIENFKKIKKILISKPHSLFYLNDAININISESLKINSLYEKYRAITAEIEDDLFSELESEIYSHLQDGQLEDDHNRMIRDEYNDWGDNGYWNID